MTIRFSCRAALLLATVLSTSVRAEEKPARPVERAVLPAAGKTEEVQIACELRFVTIPDVLLERVGLNFEGGSPRDSVLDNNQVSSLCDLFQGDRRASILQAPKLTLLDGQGGTIQSGKLSVTLQPTVTQDRNFRIRLATDWAECGVKYDKTVSIPAGKTALLFVGLRVSEGALESSPPVLGKIPYINRLVKNVGYARETERVLVLLTPEVLSLEPDPLLAEDIEVGCPSRIVFFDTARIEERVRKLLKAYEVACERGEGSKALALSMKALTLDPTCFSKSRKTLTHMTFDRIHGGIE